jgi:surface antigen
VNQAIECALLDLHQGPDERFCRCLAFATIQAFEGKTMSLNHNVLIPIVTGLMLAGAAQAQMLPTWETHITLTQQDLDMIHAVVTDQLHGKPLGTKVSWSNPASGNSGYVKLNKKVVKNGQRCEGIGYTVRSKGPPVYTEHYHFISCLQPDGAWKIA